MTVSVLFYREVGLGYEDHLLNNQLPYKHLTSKVAPAGADLQIRASGVLFFRIKKAVREQVSLILECIVNVVFIVPHLLDFTFDML